MNSNCSENNVLPNNNNNLITSSNKRISIDDYLKHFNIKNYTLVVIINLNTPCGHCLNYLMSKIQNEETNFRKANIYYIFYADNPTFARMIIDNYNLTSCDLIKIDNYQLSKIYNKNDMELYPYYIIESLNSKTTVYKLNYNNFLQTFDKLIKIKTTNK